MQHCFEVAAVAAGTVGEGKVEEDIVDGVNVDKEVGYEQTDSSIQEAKKLDGLVVVVSMVTKS